MSYTPTSWNTGDTITASALNKIENGIADAGGASWDAVIRLVHAENSGTDTPQNLTPSIVSGTFAQLANKMMSGGYPCILVEYYHPWGGQFSAPMAYTVYCGANDINIEVAGVSMSEGCLFKKFGTLFWSNADVLTWD